MPDSQSGGAGDAKAAQARLRGLYAKEDFALFRVELASDGPLVEQLPAIFFTKQGGFPVVVSGRDGDQYCLRLWDERETLCSSTVFKKSFRQSGFSFRDRSVRESAGQRFSRVWPLISGRAGYLAWGGACGLAGVLALFFLAWAFHGQIKADVEGMPRQPPWLPALGIATALLAALGFLQVRSWLTCWGEARSATMRSRSQRFPETRLIRSLLGVETGRELTELALLPLVATASVMAAGGAPAASVVLAVAALAYAAQGRRFVAKCRSLRSLSLPAEAAPVLPGRDKYEENRRLLEPVTDSAIRVHNLCLNHPDEVSRPILDHLSFLVKKGERTGVFCESPACNAILLRVLAGSIRADRGAIWMNNSLTAGETGWPGNILGWFSERHPLVAGSLQENICLGHPSPFPLERLTDVLASVGIGEHGSFREGLASPIAANGEGLSRRETLQVLLARSLVHDPSILIAEAPRDPGEDAFFQAVLEAALRDSSRTLLLAANRGTLLSALTIRTLFLKKGKIVRDGETQRVVDEIEHDLKRRTRG